MRVILSLLAANTEHGHWSTDSRVWPASAMLQVAAGSAAFVACPVAVSSSTPAPAIVNSADTPVLAGRVCVQGIVGGIGPALFGFGHGTTTPGAPAAKDKPASLLRV